MFQEFLQNKMLIGAGVAWALAQIVKFIIHLAVTRKFDLSRLWGDGGMPSCHSATVCSLATIAFMEHGIGSPFFAISAIFAIIVMHDAMGVRLEAGKHAKEINNINEWLQFLLPEFKKGMTPENQLKEFLGHTPSQVTIGGIFGIIVGIVFYLVF